MRGPADVGPVGFGDLGEQVGWEQEGDAVSVFDARHVGFDAVAHEQQADDAFELGFGLEDGPVGHGLASGLVLTWTQTFSGLGGFGLSGMGWSGLLDFWGGGDR